MRLTLADHVHGAVLGGDLVLLDVNADIYFCLPAGDHVAKLSGNALDASPKAFAMALYEAGLAQAATVITPRASPPLSPTRTARAALDAAPDIKSTPTTWRHLQVLVRSAATARRMLRRPFVERIGGQRVAAGAVSGRLLADIAVFRRLAPWLPIDGACLFRSLMLRAYLNDLGHGVTWCFGVRTWPFQAHCWLQVEDMALDDEAERLCAFHPIMAV